MKLSLVLIILLSCNRVFCSENSSVMTFCSPNAGQLKTLMTNIKFLKTDKDRLLPEGLCIKINTTNSREELFYKYIQARQPHIKITNLNSLSEKATCNLEIRKIMIQDNQNRLIKNKMQKIEALDKKFNKNHEETINFSTLVNTPTQITIKNSQLDITCTKKRDNLYHLGLVTQSKLLAINTAITTKAGVWKKIGDYNSKGFDKSKEIGIINNKISHQNNSIKLSIDLRVKRK